MRQLLLDANLLVLLVVGLKDRALVGKHKRTRQFSIEDFDLLVAWLGDYEQILVTPNVLTEASNLLRQPRSQSGELMGVLRDLIDRAEERHIPSASVATSDDFPRLGLTDVALVEIVGEDLPLLTVDLELFVASEVKAPGAAKNFNHYRDVSA